MSKLKNKTIVVTGGAGLLGREFVKAIVKNEGKAIIADINPELSKNVKNEIVSSLQIDPLQIACFKLDITSKKSIQELIKSISKTEKIDALVNNAYPINKNYGKHFFDVEYDDFCENVNMNLGGYFLCSQIFAKYFIENGLGNIINISSIYGVIPPRFEIYDNTKMTMPVEYSIIKSGLIHLTKYMSKYLKGNNIRVNTISPGGIIDSQPKKFIAKYKNQCLNKGMLDAEDLTGTLIFLLGNDSKHINGQNIIVDDGFTL